MAKQRIKRLIAGMTLCVMLFLLLPAMNNARAEYDMDHPELLTAADLNCKACILIEAESGDTVFTKNADTRMYPASTTKILTTLLACKYIDDLSGTDTIVSPLAMFYTPSDSSKLGLYEYEQINMLDLLYGTMLTSGNDGANVIAEAVCGSIEAFVQLMNRAAAAYGCTSTHFANPHGYQDENHYTTARDMATIARIAMQDETFKKIADATTYTIDATNMSARRDLVIANNWFRVLTEGHEDCYYEYGNGIKTGSTSDAGYCYVASAEKNGITLISVVFGCTSRARSYQDSIKLLEYGYSQYVQTSVAELYAKNPNVVEISGYATDDANVGKLTLNLKRISQEGDDTIVTTRDGMQVLISNLRDYTVTEYTREFSAPIEAGEVMGTLSYYPSSGAEPVVYQLIASRSIARREGLAPSVSQIHDAVWSDPNPFPPLSIQMIVQILLAIGAVLLLIGLIRKLIKKLKNRPKRGRAARSTERYYT